MRVRVLALAALLFDAREIRRGMTQGEFKSIDLVKAVQCH